MNKMRIKRKEEDLYRINISDDGKEIVFDLADIGLPFKCEKAFQKVEKNKQVARGKALALEKKEATKQSGELMSDQQKEILNIYNDMFKVNREIMDEFFGCPGAMDALFGDSNYLDMYDDLFEQLEPHFTKMELNVETIKLRLEKKYSKKNSNVLS